jgi:uncharacterized protein (UPF0332 family)
MGYSADLLSLSDDLVASGAGRPRQANLRRAISSAYYAAFYVFCERAVGSVLTQSDSKGKLGRRLQRTIEHARAVEAAKCFANSNQRTGKIGALLGANATRSKDLSDFCKNFVYLYEARHLADYDFSKQVSRADARMAVQRASAAVAALSRVADTHEEFKVLMLASIAKQLER